MSVEEKIDTLTRRLEELTELTASRREPYHKFCLTVEELAERWALCPEAVRRLIREKKLRPLRGFRPFRITLDEIKRYESLDDGLDVGKLLKGGRR